MRETPTLPRDPEALLETYSRAELEGEAAEDLASGDWIFGRGIFDMKTGVAALIHSS
ncbi:MAG: hypothetical protein MZU95_11920 [Desulfomicrobium escambiense]|nr:hypothetical protein [Desulfomicrobium escambiense]